MNIDLKPHLDNDEILVRGYNVMDDDGVMRAYVEWPVGVARDFRMIVRPRQVAKLARVADTISVYVEHLGGCYLTPQKGSLAQILSGMEADDSAMIAVTFNGLDLMVIGLVDLGEDVV